MQITYAAEALPQKGAIVIVVSDGVKLGKLAATLDKKMQGALMRAVKQQGYKGKKGELLSLVAPVGLPYDAVILAGLGKVSEIQAENIRKLGGKLYAALNGLHIKDATILMESIKKEPEILAQVGIGLQLRAYQFDKYKTKEREKYTVYLKNAVIACASHKEVLRAYEGELPVIAGVYVARDVVTEPSNILYPESYAARIKEELAPLGVNITILDAKQMKAEGMNALLGVGMGSERESRLVVMEWVGDKTAKKQKKAPLGFVGKGVTFDTGGISIKPANNMWDMKYDMAGSAAVVGLLKAVALSKLKVNVVGVVGLVENMPSGRAQRPGDVVTSMSGKTIEVLNTDAEGRLVLCDALTYIQKYYQPASIVNLATLTGAIVISLGFDHAGLFSNNDVLSEDLKQAGLETDEKLWRLPLGRAYDRLMDSPIADMQNINLDRGAGSITAAQFLQRFIENDTPWAHLDIAGTAWAEKDRDICPKGATGFGVRLLYQFVQNSQKKPRKRAVANA